MIPRGGGGEREGGGWRRGRMGEFFRNQNADFTTKMNFNSANETYCTPNITYGVFRIQFLSRGLWVINTMLEHSGSVWHIHWHLPSRAPIDIYFNIGTLPTYAPEPSRPIRCRTLIAIWLILYHSDANWTFVGFTTIDKHQMMIIIGNIPSDDHSYYHNIRKCVSENDSQIAGQPHGHTHVYVISIHI